VTEGSIRPSETASIRGVRIIILLLHSL
jgi:hypothetical protein